MKFYGVVILAVCAFAGSTIVSAGATGLAPRGYTPEALAGRTIGPMAAHSVLTLHVVLAGQHENELDSFIQMQSEQGSPAFGRYLTPQQFGAYFGADPVTYANAVRYLRANGFAIVDLPNNRREIEVAAPVATISRFFQTPVDMHEDATHAFYAPRYEPVLPAALHAEFVAGLDDYRVMQSHLRVRPAAKVNGQVSWSPQDLAIGYDLGPLYSANLDGKGISIANATKQAANPSDLVKFEQIFKLPAAHLTTVPIGGAVSYANNGESTLDVDSATSVAREATFVQVVAHGYDDFDDVYKYIVNTLAPTVHVVTTSWGSCEPFNSKSELKLDNGYFQQAASEGQWWFSASGDSGTDDCGGSYPSVKQLSVDFPGSSPYVISVGGTDVHAATSNYNVTAWKSETVWAWGNCNYYNGGSNGAGGGGASVVYPKPSYQTGRTPNDGARDVPDVSLLSDDVNDGLFVVDGGKLYAGNGGTSEAAPQWAALLAIVEQKKGNYKKVADPHARLYQLAAGSTRSQVFHDVVGGNNGVPRCASYSRVYAGYNAVTGYDLAGGIGSYIGAALVNKY